MEHLQNFDWLTILLLIICLLAVIGFEFINGFHDTANAVATVIYTRSLKPKVAVVWSGFWNFLGVYAGGVAVAMGIIKLMPLADMANQPASNSIALILSILISAIAWNLLTWYFGIPCSSSHTMIGSLLGAGMAFQFFYAGAGPNWDKAKDIGLSLLMSPVFGFAAVILLMLIMRLVAKNKILFSEPTEDSKPPMWIRAILITTCTLVSFFHGSNDGQKGVGLLLIILLTFLPVHYALNPDKPITESVASLDKLEVSFGRLATANPDNKEISGALEKITEAKAKISTFDENDKKLKFTIRKDFQSLAKTFDNMKKDTEIRMSGEDKKIISSEIGALKDYTDYAPLWTIIMISISLGVGTMIGWKRIVVTIGEKIGKTHLTYAQGAAAELVAATTIGLSTGLGLPVSTTHVLSSGVAGSMVAAKGVKNLQKGTITNIALAWILTLPVTILLAAGLYFIFHLFL